MRVRYISGIYHVISFGLFIAVDFVMSLLFYFILSRIKFTFPKSLSAAVILTAADQLLKIVIYKFDVNAKLAGSLLRIEPTPNLNQTAMFNLLGLELNGTFIIAFKAVIIVLLCCIFLKIKNKSVCLWYAFVLLLSAGISTLADSAVWGYTLDYVYFSKLTCYDLKDFYVDAAIGFIIIEALFGKHSTSRRSHKNN